MERRKLSDEEIGGRLGTLTGWRAEGVKLTKRFEFADFAASLSFVNKVGELAEAADHHPDIHFGWGFAEFEITTHDCGGLTDHDFALAAKIDQVR